MVQCMLQACNVHVHAGGSVVVFDGKAAAMQDGPAIHFDQQG